MKGRAKTYDVVLEVWLYFGIGSALPEPPYKTIAEIARASGHCWEATRDAIVLLEALNLVQNVRGKYQIIKQQSSAFAITVDVGQKGGNEHGT
jgi:hypothetical protein